MSTHIWFRLEVDRFMYTVCIYIIYKRLILSLDVGDFMIRGLKLLAYQPKVVFFFGGGGG